MKRWVTGGNGKEAENQKIDLFLEEVIAVSKKHGLSISHEDGYGAFEIELFSNENAAWLMDAKDSTDFNKEFS